MVRLADRRMVIGAERSVWLSSGGFEDPWDHQESRYVAQSVDVRDLLALDSVELQMWQSMTKNREFSCWAPPKKRFLNVCVFRSHARETPSSQCCARCGKSCCWAQLLASYFQVITPHPHMIRAMRTCNTRRLSLSRFRLQKIFMVDFVVAFFIPLEPGKSFDFQSANSRSVWLPLFCTQQRPVVLKVS